MRNLFLIIAFTISIFGLNQLAYAVKAIPHPVVVTQPDGSELTIRVHGDEFGRYRTTEDGYLLSQNDKGFYVYDLAGSAINTAPIVARNISKRTQADLNFLKTINKADATAIYASKPQ
ncbi:MAG: hypothetical protein ACOYM7_07835, partial [Paludibacter sp.]